MENYNIIATKFLDLNIKIGFGFEIEFYILNKNKEPMPQDNFIPAIQAFLIENNFQAIVHKEIELGQVEIASLFTFDVLQCIDKCEIAFDKLKSFFQQNTLEINHSAKPFLNKAGNGLHINISLHDILTNENLFGCKDFMKYSCFDQNFYHQDIQNSLLAYSIAGLLNEVEKNRGKYLFNESTMNRVKYPDMNSPRNISWGYNNRTTLLRIPESLPNTKRLENRLPSSENDLLQTTIYVLEDIYDGIVNKMMPQKCTFGLAYDEQYNIKSLLL